MLQFNFVRHGMSQIAITRFAIYCRTNTLNGKLYVGQTSFSSGSAENAVKRRMAAGYHHSQLIMSALKKYGESAFDSVVLEVVGNRETADASEGKWIKQLNTLAPNGYNLMSGGMVAVQHASTKAKMRQGGLARMANLSEKERAELFRKLHAGRDAHWNSLSEDEKRALIEKRRLARSPEKMREAAKKRSEAYWVTHVKVKRVRPTKPPRQNLAAKAANNADNN